MQENKCHCLAVTVNMQTLKWIENAYSCSLNGILGDFDQLSRSGWPGYWHVIPH